MWTKLIGALKAFRPKDVILGGLKKLAIREVQKEGDRLQAELRGRLAKEGPGSIDRTIDAAQRRITVAIKTQGPTWAFLDPIREKIAEALQAWGDKLQERIKKEVASYGPTAVDLAFDTAQKELIAAIEALQL